MYNAASGSVISFHSESLLAKLPVKMSFSDLPISDLLSANDKLESGFLGSPLKNRSFGSWLITFYPFSEMAFDLKRICIIYKANKFKSQMWKTPLAFVHLI